MRRCAGCRDSHGVRRSPPTEGPAWARQRCPQTSTPVPWCAPSWCGPRRRPGRLAIARGPVRGSLKIAEPRHRRAALRSDPYPLDETLQQHPTPGHRCVELRGYNGVVATTAASGPCWLTPGISSTRPCCRLARTTRVSVVISGRVRRAGSRPRDESLRCRRSPRRRSRPRGWPAVTRARTVPVVASRRNSADGLRLGTRTSVRVAASACVTSPAIGVRPVIAPEAPS